MGIVVTRADKCPLVRSTGLRDSLQVRNNASCREMNGTVRISQNNIIESSQTNTEELLIPAFPEKTIIERGYVTPQQVYNLLNAEAGQPSLHDAYYILILDCRSAERYKQSHLVTARASVTVIHPELGCLISCVQLQEFSIILLYAEEGQSPVGSQEARADSPTLQQCFFHLSALGMDPVILHGGYSAFHSLYPFLCNPRMVLLESERHSLTIYPSEILEGALYQGSASQAHDYRIIKNLYITHVVNATAEISDAFPNILHYLRLRLSDDAQQNVRQAFREASKFIAEALRGAPGSPGGRVLVHCSLGRSRSSVLTLGFLMEQHRWSLLHAFRWLKERRACAAPNAGFLRQLSDYEEQLFGQRLTSLDDICL
ncbi:serine/threonine/tyrosine-interacting-like protein 1 [Triplophysa rosa]|uniref:protein-tyrosine-phosphatase n=1 Tax=Triplophysa rosa TaxID=992332 RepID=A0A9W7WJM0_TRIRA|nr:serine/threonine/tyrosine-interacting-like protein 1 [Triplophysa rosa]XP_057200596.1 serine/threonine/tyrosine-interacting-like protein 1 [Triplophysa rosa]KAI7804347.1 putative dual specificity protein phosphatase 2-like [Triplophysa rosa]